MGSGRPTDFETSCWIQKRSVRPSQPAPYTYTTGTRFVVHDASSRRLTEIFEKPFHVRFTGSRVKYAKISPNGSGRTLRPCADHTFPRGPQHTAVPELSVRGAGRYNRRVGGTTDRRREIPRADNSYSGRGGNSIGRCRTTVSSTCRPSGVADRGCYYFIPSRRCRNIIRHMCHGGRRQCACRPFWRNVRAPTTRCSRETRVLFVCIHQRAHGDAINTVLFHVALPPPPHGSIRTRRGKRTTAYYRLGFPPFLCCSSLLFLSLFSLPSCRSASRKRYAFNFFFIYLFFFCRLYARY